jgi:hypothetical protein
MNIKYKNYMISYQIFTKYSDSYSQMRLLLRVASPEKSNDGRIPLHYHLLIGLEFRVLNLICPPAFVFMKMAV